MAPLFCSHAAGHRIALGESGAGEYEPAEGIEADETRSHSDGLEKVSARCDTLDCLVVLWVPILRFGHSSVSFKVSNGSIFLNTMHLPGFLCLKSVLYVAPSSCV